ncbi:DUF2059 domain-containing protein [Terriglobus aquaticus]|uniref:DUF2059 domain-containing protein n=1 Tax=Terriglobus aquaticus TaxID=940139 RepID=A0ABW9KGA0_9BACT|nr:DUF2059 domain-containing protein [Terriglobus aquaticus]
MRRSVLFALCLCALPLSLHADDASKRTKVEEMLTLSKVDSLSKQMLASVPDRVKQAASRQMLVQTASTDQQKKITQDYLDQMGTIAQKGASWDSVHPKLVDLYMQTFTEPELDGILAFYKTPAGQALVAKSPELSGKTIQILQGTVNSMEPDFKAATLAYETNMKNATPAGGAGKAPTLGPDTPANGNAPSLKPRQ